MTHETISVRMNRSDRNIRWGFSVRQQADGLIIDRVDAESLSDKAGVKHGDKVEQINGRSTRGLDAHTANNLINDSSIEVRISLQRFVTSHTTLPWTLNEKDNKMIVEEVKPGFGSSFGHTTNFGSGFGSQNQHQQHNQQHNQYQQSNTTSRYNNSQSYSSTQAGTGHNVPINVGSTTNYINQSSNFNSQPVGFGTHGGNANNYSSSHGYGNGTSGHSVLSPSGQNQQNNTGYSNTNGISNYHNNAPRSIPIQTPPPSSYSYNNGATTQSFGTGAGGVPLNQMTFINTTTNPASQGGLSPGKVFYHSPSARSKNDLSPGASIQHLQYNSPMNLYSSETAADQYYQQTGKLPEGPVPHDKIPAYLTSETKKLIEEEARGRFNRGKSPSSQSSCFKRISHAVGTD